MLTEDIKNRYVQDLQHMFNRVIEFMCRFQYFREQIQLFANLLGDIYKYIICKLFYSRKKV